VHTNSFADQLNKGAHKDMGTPHSHMQLNKGIYRQPQLRFLDNRK
jgi:hypothetical protein